MCAVENTHCICFLHNYYDTFRFDSVQECRLWTEWKQYGIFNGMDTSFYTQIKDHLVSNILPFWEKYGKDPVTEDFCSSIDSNCKADNHASRSVLLPSDILWTYSSAARLFISADYMKTAEFAFLSLKRHFFDTLNGGFYWTVKADGTPENTEKQTAAQAAALYGLCEYAAALKEVLKLGYLATVVMDCAL